MDWIVLQDLVTQRTLPSFVCFDVSMTGCLSSWHQPYEVYWVLMWHQHWRSGNKFIRLGITHGQGDLLIAFMKVCCNLSWKCEWLSGLKSLILILDITTLCLTSLVTFSYTSMGVWLRSLLPYIISDSVPLYGTCLLKEAWVYVFWANCSFVSGFGREKLRKACCI